MRTTETQPQKYKTEMRNKIIFEESWTGATITHATKQKYEKLYKYTGDHFS